jgi:serine/threonine-protein kinase HipA
VVAIGARKHSTMTSEVFVYLTLPGHTSPVTAGRFELATGAQGMSVGRFVYGKRYLARPDAVPIDPIELKLEERVFQTGRLRGMFGSLRDASPDYWGRRVIEKHAGRANLPELDYLLNSPDDRAGALGFGLNVNPPAPLRAFNRTMDLSRLQDLADLLIAEDDPTEHTSADRADLNQVQDLLLMGTAMGGARPKAVVENDDALWIVKFNRRDDRWNCARVEHAMLALARECGLWVSQSRLTQIGNRDALLVKRFDREHSKQGYRRARMLSALTLLRAEDSHQDRDRWSYLTLAEELRRISAQPKTDAPELFRRMAFNALISNLDDHPRNHAVIAMHEEWRLSPAYDLTPTTAVSLERRDLAMICGNRGRYANAQNLLSQCGRFLLSREHATAILSEMESKVKQRWSEIARRVGVTNQDCHRIGSAFAYEGFRFPLDATA